MADTPAGFASDPPPRSKQTSNADWRGPASGPSKGTVVAVTFILLLAVGGVIGGLLFWTKAPVEAQFVTIPIDQYGPAWPVNPWAGGDSARLNAVFGDRGRIAFNYQQADKFRQWLDWLAAREGATAADLPAEFEKRPLVLHVTALAAVNANGVHLLLPGAETVEWFPLEKLLDAVSECRAPKKVLLLDIAHPVADPFNGILADDVAAGLDALLTKRKAEKKLPCAVLTSCGPGQLSLPCDPERCSAFAFYVAEGLKGGADGCLEGSKADEQITINELARFVGARVDRWAQRVHARRQSPMLYAPDDGDLVVAYRQKFGEDRYDTPAPTAYPAGLAQAWQTLAAAELADAPFTRVRLDADALLAAETMALRSEGADRAGETWRSIQAGWAKSAPGLPTTVSSADVIRNTSAHAARWRLPATPSTTDPKIVGDIGKALDALLAAKGEDEAKAKPVWQAKAAEAPADAVRLVWQRALATERPERGDLRRWVDALSAVRLPRASSEVLLLERLSKYDFVQAQELPRMPAEAVAALLKAEAAAGRVALAHPTGFGALAGRLARADTRRRDAEKALFAAKTMADAGTAGNALAVAAVEFDGVLKALANRQGARTQALKALAVLLATQPAAVRHNTPDFGTWRQSAAVLKSLFDKLAAAEENAASDGSEWTGELAELATLLPALEPPNAEALAKLLKDVPTRTNAKDIEALAAKLTGPMILGPARADVANAVAADRFALHKAVRQLDKADDEAKVTIPPPLVDVPAANVDLALRLAESAVLLLQVANAGGAAPALAAFQKVQADPANAAAWDALASLLKTEWQGGITSQVRGAKPAVAERLLRVTPAGVARHRDPSAGSPGLEMLKADAAAHRRWLLKQLADDAPLRAKGDVATRFYDEARTELQTAP